MKGSFRWKSMGLTLQHESGIMVNAANFNDVIDESHLENLFNLGYYFTSSTHHITIADMNDYHKYIKIN